VVPVETMNIPNTNKEVDEQMSASQRGRTAERPARNGKKTVTETRPDGSLPSHLDLDGLPGINGSAESELDTVQEYIAAGQELAQLGCWEDAYQRMAAAVALLNGRALPAHAELTQLRQEHEKVREQARRDFLTASYNRRYLDDRLETLLEDPSVTQLGMALAMVDIDHFKTVNDRYGHPFGDRVLRSVVSVLDAVLESEASDGAFCARYGGEEFALVLPGADLDQAAARADALRTAIRDIVIVHRGRPLGPPGYDPVKAVSICERARVCIDKHPWSDLAPELRVTVSVGIAHTVAAPPDVEQLLVGADVLLYAAKGAGRNAVAYRTDQGRVALAGPAGARRDIPQPADVD
jgi:diguanylate cyclase (GGDEF)-like protein